MRLPSSPGSVSICTVRASSRHDRPTLCPPISSPSVNGRTRATTRMASSSESSIARSATPRPARAPTRGAAMS